MKITKEQLKYILSEDCEVFEEKILANCFCGNCLGEECARMVDWQASLDNFNDVVLRGKCAECGRPICRVLETGEREECVGRIGEVKKIINSKDKNKYDR